MCGRGTVARVIAANRGLASRYILRLDTAITHQSAEQLTENAKMLFIMDGGRLIICALVRETSGTRL